MSEPLQATVYSITLQLQVLAASAQIRFPCLLFAQWSTNNHKIIRETGRYAHVQGKAEIKETLTLTTEMLYDHAAKAFQKKQSHLQLSLVSKSRPNDPKLVGRCSIDLAEVVNQQLYASTSDIELQFTSVSAMITIRTKVAERIQTDISLSEFDRSYSQNISLRLTNLSEAKDRQSSSRSSFQISKSSFDGSRSTFKKEAGSTMIQENKESKIAEDEVKQVEQEVKPRLTPQSKSNFKNTAKEVPILNAASDSKRLKTEEKEDTSSVHSGRKTPSVRAQSIRSGEFRLPNQDYSRQKLELERLKAEHERQGAQSERVRKELDEARKERELLKLQLKQKGTLLQHATQQNSFMKGQLGKLKDQLGKGREDSVSYTLKLAELREVNNKVSIQLGSAEREVKRLEGVTEQLRQAQQSKRGVANQLKEVKFTQKTLKSKCQMLTKQKQVLQEGLNEKHALHSQALQLCASHEKNYNTLKKTLQGELKTVNALMEDEKKQKQKHEKTIDDLNKQVQKMKKLEKQLTGAHHESNSHRERTKQLEESLLTLHEQISNLEQVKSQLSSELKQLKVSFTNLEKNKEGEARDAVAKILDLQESVMQLNDALTLERQQKSQLENELSEMRGKNDTLAMELENERQEVINQGDTILGLQSLNVEQNIKIQQFEETLLKLGDQREAERNAASVKERDLTVRVAELEGELANIEQSVGAGADKITGLQVELQSREALIIKMQEGLQAQIEHSEALNRRLMGYIERQEGSKNIVTACEQQMTRIAQLLDQQETKDQINAQNMQNKDKLLDELSRQLEESTAYAQSIEKDMINNGAQAQKQIDAYVDQIEVKRQQVHQISLKLNQARQRNSVLEKNIKQVVSESGEKLSQHRESLNEVQGSIAALQAQKVTLTTQLEQQGFRITQLTAEIQKKQTQLENRHKQVDQLTSEIQQAKAAIQANEEQYIQALTDLQSKIQVEASKFQQLQLQIARKDQLHLQEVSELNLRLQTVSQQLKSKQEEHQILQNDKAVLDINKHKDEMSQNAKLIATLQSELKTVSGEASKIPSLQRSLKIKSIQLSSIKYNKKDEDDELAKLKDEQIQTLKGENNKLFAQLKAVEELKERVSALQDELELIEEEKFNIESISNEKVFVIEELREENKNLMQEITTIGLRNGQLQRAMEQIVSKASGNEAGSSNEVENIILISEVQQLRNQLHNFEQCNKKLQEELEEKNMVDILDEQIRKSEGKGNAEATPDNIKQTYLSLKQLIETRRNDQTQLKVIDMLNQVLQQSSTNSQPTQKLRLLSKEFQKLKSQFLRSPSKAPQERVKMMDGFRRYEGVINEVLAVFAGR